MRIFGAAVLMAGIGLASLPALADVKAGVEAWQRGDYNKAIAEWRGPAVAGDPDAQFNLGQAYKLGRGVAADLAQAEQWYRKAALQGHPQAEENYGLILFENNKRLQAAEWLQKAAARGEPRSQYVLGTMFFNGDGVEKDWPRAYALTVRAAAQGLPQASTAQAQMDRYISLTDRQKGLELARAYERDAARPQVAMAEPVPPVRQPASPPRTVPDEAKAPQAAQTRPTPPIVRPAPKPAPSAAKAEVRRGSWRVQIGAFGDPANARKAGAQAAARFANRQIFYEKAGKLTKVLVGPFASNAEASKACGSVNPCVPVRN